MSVKRIRRRNVFPRRHIRLVLSFIWIRIAAVGRFIAVSPLVRRVVRLRAVRFLVRLLVFLWSRLIWPAWRWCKRSVHLVRKSLGRHEVWYWAATWVGCALLAYSIAVWQPSMPVAAVLTLMIIPIIAKRMEIGVLLVMIMTASFMHTNVIPQPLKFGGQGLNASELLVFFMFTVVLLKSLSKKTAGILKSPFLPPLVLFGVSIALSLLVAYVRGIHDTTTPYSFKWSYATARPLFGYLLFFSVAFALRTERQIRFVVNGAIVIAVIVAMMMVLQYFMGTGTRLFLGTETANIRVEELSGDVTGVTRSLPPGMALMLIMLPVSVVLSALSTGRARNVYGGVVLCLCAGLVFMFTRNYWLTSILSMIIAWLMMNWMARWKMILIGSAVLVLAVVAMLGATRLAGEGGAKFAKALSDRFSSSFESQTYSSPSVTGRLEENRYAMDQIKRYPIFGIGVGNPLSYKQGMRPWGRTMVRFPCFWMHNSYLELWAVYGIIGILSFFWLSATFFKRSLAVFRRAQNLFQSAVGVGLFAAYVGFMIRAIVTMSVLHEAFNITSVALAWGIIEAIHRLQNVPCGQPIEAVSVCTRTAASTERGVCLST